MPAFEASALLPVLKEVMKFADADKLKSTLATLGDPSLMPAVTPPGAAAAVVTPPIVKHAGRMTTDG